MTTVDVRADNGVIHAVDQVLVPPGVLSVVQMAQANPATFSSLVGALVSTNLAPVLSGAGPFTVFAPTNTAFAAAPTGLTTAQLTSVLTHHVVAGQVLTADIPFGRPVATLATRTLAGATVPAQTITINSNLSITDTTATAGSILATDVRASNGVIHVIGKVLIPKWAGRKKAVQHEAERLAADAPGCLTHGRPVGLPLAGGEVEQANALLRRPPGGGGAPAKTRAASNRLPCLAIEFGTLRQILDDNRSHDCSSVTALAVVGALLT